MINRKIELDLKWIKNYLISEISRTFTAVDPNAEEVEDEVVTATTGGTFQLNNAKHYVPVVPLSINDNIKFLENIKQGFKRTTSSNKCRSEIATQTKSNNLDYLIDLALRNINRLFVLSFKNGDDDPTRYYSDENYISLVEIKEFNALINNKPFFDHPVKNKQEAHEKRIEMSKNGDYSKGNP